MLLVILDWIFSCCSAIGRGTHVMIAVLDYCTPVALGKEGARDVILCHEKSTLERPLIIDHYLSNFSMYCSLLKGSENFLSIH